MVTHQELKMVWRESNEINGEEIVLCLIAQKKNCLLLIRSEKNCTFNLDVKKKFDHKEKPQPPPHVSNGPPLRKLICINSVQIGTKDLLTLEDRCSP